MVDYRDSAFGLGGVSQIDKRDRDLTAQAGNLVKYSPKVGDCCARTPVMSCRVKSSIEVLMVQAFHGPRKA
ncbi:uncharacterized protein RCO7_14982 [Rhynchosporium graminicola]|uniref:Uncharacterized protein n=2 Tax=Rhynchosporium TaxID=38037 RepID=A0A1E1ML45_RHYSE|nr:uncharacterized protein RCO7_14982 [Rhynchosporium commune]CZT49813.1 uncharacterized protein RSE6_10705 [Rhynchosporium secalis]